MCPKLCCCRLCRSRSKRPKTAVVAKIVWLRLDWSCSRLAFRSPRRIGGRKGKLLRASSRSGKWSRVVGGKYTPTRWNLQKPETTTLLRTLGPNYLVSSMPPIGCLGDEGEAPLMGDGFCKDDIITHAVFRVDIRRDLCLSKDGQFNVGQL
jgi:hypothetical protein